MSFWYLLAGSGSKPDFGLMSVASTLLPVQPANEYQCFSREDAEKRASVHSIYQDHLVPRKLLA